MKYLGFFLKPNDYRKRDWVWLLEKLEKRLKTWNHRWLSRDGRLVMFKAIMEAIPVYWMSLAWIPKGILEKAHRICFRFLCSGKQEAHVTLLHFYQKSDGRHVGFSTLPCRMYDTLVFYKRRKLVVGYLTPK